MKTRFHGHELISIFGGYEIWLDGCYIGYEDTLSNAVDFVMDTQEG